MLPPLRLLLCSALCLVGSCAACDDADFTLACASAGDCGVAQACIAGVCAPAAGDVGGGEGEGDGGEGDGGEGDGAEGEGDVGEGEGDAGEGEGDVGEGEGDVGEGEGEGEGEPCIPAGHDEDNDGVDDACDDCPADADAVQSDGDDDGVGDACDPHATTPGDFIAFFDGFGGSALRPEWVVGDGDADWRVSGNQLQHPALTTSNVLEVNGLDLVVAVVDTRVIFDDADVSPGTANAGVLLHASGDDGELCMLQAEDTGNEFVQINRLENGDAGSSLAFDFVNADFSARRITGSVDAGANYHCVASNSPVDVAVDANDGFAANGSIGVRANRIALRADYVVAYGVR